MVNGSRAKINHSGGRELQVAVASAAGVVQPLPVAVATVQRPRQRGVDAAGVDGTTDLVIAVVQKPVFAE